MEKIKVTNKELQLMHILWDADGSLTANQICDADSSLIMSTVQTVLRNLIQKNLIAVDEIVLVGKAFSRNYKPLMEQEAFILNQYPNVDMDKLVSMYQEMHKK